MTKEELREKVTELLERSCGQMTIRINRAIASGALDYSEEEHWSYRSAKIITAALLSFESDLWEPNDKQDARRHRRDVKNVILCSPF